MENSRVLGDMVPAISKHYNSEQYSSSLILSCSYRLYRAVSWTGAWKQKNGKQDASPQFVLQIAFLRLIT